MPMDKDEVFESMGDLYREGYVDMKPAVGDVDPEKRQFSVNESGMGHFADMVQDEPKMTEMLIAVILSEHSPDSMEDLFGWIRDNLNTNPIEDLEKTDPHWFDTDGIDEELRQEYEPE